MESLTCPKCQGNGIKTLNDYLNSFDCLVCGFHCAFKNYRAEWKKAETMAMNSYVIPFKAFRHEVAGKQLWKAALSNGEITAGHKTLNALMLAVALLKY